MTERPHTKVEENNNVYISSVVQELHSEVGDHPGILSPRKQTGMYQRTGPYSFIVFDKKETLVDRGTTGAVDMSVGSIPGFSAGNERVGRPTTQTESHKHISSPEVEDTAQSFTRRVVLHSVPIRPF